MISGGSSNGVTKGVNPILNSECSADVRFGAHSGLKPGTALPKSATSSDNIARIAFWAPVSGLTGEVRRHLINVLE
jgi:hypothetical protein